MVARTKEDLTPRELLFAGFYCENGGDGKRAYISAGYSPNGAAHGAWRLLQRPAVREHIRDIMKARGATPEGCKAKFLAIKNSRMMDFEDWLKGTKTLKDLDKEGVDTSVIKSAEMTTLKDGSSRRKLQFHDGMEATVHIAKMLGAYTEKREIQTTSKSFPRLKLDELSAIDLERIAHATSQTVEQVTSDIGNSPATLGASR